MAINWRFKRIDFGVFRNHRLFLPGRLNGTWLPSNSPLCSNLSTISHDRLFCMTRENAFRKHREAWGGRDSQPSNLPLTTGSGCRQDLEVSCVDILFTMCFSNTEDYIFTQSHHHQQARGDWDDAMLNWTKSTCGFCSSITTATTQRANKLKKSNPFASIKLFSEHNPAAVCCSPRPSLSP